MASEAIAHRVDADATRRATATSRSLAATMPRLILEARRVAATVMHGLHGRRRAGPGENFWQYRRFVWGEPAGRVDWRRSARDEHLYVREREWEAAHTVWLWPDRSASMAFASALVADTKLDRTLVIAFALGHLLVEGGERIGIPGLMRPTADRNVIDKMAQAIVHDHQAPSSLPPAARLSRFSSALLFGDFLDPPSAIAQRFNAMAEAGVVGHVVQILDPAEETLAYQGRIEFRSPETSERWIADRVETLRPAYQQKLAEHRASLEEITRRIGWSFLLHHTDRPAAEPLLSLIMRLQGMASDYRWKIDVAAGAGARP